MFAPHWRYLVGLAARKGAGQDAEDIATEAILRAAWADELDEQAPLRYLQRTVQNLTIDRHRNAGYRDTLSRHAAMIPRQRALEDGVADHDLAVRALRRLRDTQGPFTAWLVWRHVVDDVPLSQLAAEVGLSASSVQSQIWRAMRSLRAWLLRASNR